MLPWVLPKVSSHAYLRPGFRLSDGSRRMLLGRYRRSIELMDVKLERFWNEARSAGLLDDTLVVVTADHGEAFGEHDLYFHDASVYDTHLHVPLWIHHPALAPAVVDDVVSTRALFDVLWEGARGTVKGLDRFGTVYVVDQLPIGTTPASNREISSRSSTSCWKRSMSPTMRSRAARERSGRSSRWLSITSIDAARVIRGERSSWLTSDAKRASRSMRS